MHIRSSIDRIRGSLHWFDIHRHRQRVSEPHSRQQRWRVSSGLQQRVHERVSDPHKHRIVRIHWKLQLLVHCERGRVDELQRILGVHQHLPPSDSNRAFWSLTAISRKRGLRNIVHGIVRTILRGRNIHMVPEQHGMDLDLQHDCVLCLGNG